MTTGHKIVSNVFYYFLDFLTLVLGGYVFWVLMGKMLTPDQYGILTAVLAMFYVLMTIALTGFPESIPKFTSELIKRGNTSAAGGMIRHSIKVSLTLGLVLSAALYFASGWLSQEFYGNSSMTAPLQIIAALLLAANIGNTTKAILQGLQNFRAMFIADIIGNIGKIVAAICFVMLGWAALGAAAAWVLFFALTSVICGWAVLRTRLPTGSFDKRTFWRFSAISTVSQLSYYLVQQAGVLVLALLANASVVGYFGVAALFGQILTFVPSVLSGALFPSLSELWVNRKDDVRKLLMAALKISTLAVLPFVALFTLASRPLIEIIYSKSYISAAPIFPAYMLGSFLFGLVLLMMVALYAMSRPLARLAIIFSSAVLNIVLCFLLIPTLGAIGAAFAFLTSQIVVLIAAVFAVNQSITMAFSRRSLWAIPAVALFGTVLLLHNLTTSLWLKAGVAAVALVVYVSVLLATKAVGRRELVLLKYFPDKFGFGMIKKIATSIVGLFEKF